MEINIMLVAVLVDQTSAQVESEQNYAGMWRRLTSDKGGICSTVTSATKLSTF